METDKGLVRQIESDLGLNSPFIKGQKITIRRCWHFSTDGNAVDVIFRDDRDFIDAMNSIYIVQRKHGVTILAFALMDTHVHFILHGELGECNSFMHELIARISRQISLRHGETGKMDGVPINYQTIDNDRYLKTAICYVVKNPPVAGLPFMAWNYPWSSGPLYFRGGRHWTGMSLPSDMNISELSARKRHAVLKSRAGIDGDPALFDGMVLPHEFVAVDLVEKIFRTAKSYNYFLCSSKEEDVESKGGNISRLSIPMQEMRQHKEELCQAMFGVRTVKTLNTQQRLKLARALRRKYNSSLKQVARLCGLVCDEVKEMLQ
ncbi:MAG: hypothetical protein MJY72_01300 [Bacteroidales bacterium]|nr:hypothetical protein [Bacteroidales bacterium]